MCNRFSAYGELGDVVKKYTVNNVVDYKKRWNVPPQSTGYVVVSPQPGFRVLMPMRWGFVWGDSPDPKPAIRPTNARHDKLTGYWRDPFLRSRCMIPATGAYEFKPVTAGRKTLRVPYH